MVSATFSSPSSIDIVARLTKKAYDAKECSAAIKGKALPKNLGNEIARLCTIRGIRYHAAFAQSDAVAALSRETTQTHPEFARACNARIIMSNTVPALGEPDTYPYCIWHPKIATEATYRELASRYPDMRYQVGRACAAAGYSALYAELDLLPDVSIAEEAREGPAESKPIFEAIMNQPTKYAVMNDWARTVDPTGAKPGAYLNGDTMVRATLEYKQQHHAGLYDPGSFRNKHKRYANITEDWSIDDRTSPEREVVLTDDEIALLYSPLPPDLPTLNKDLLILMAAYTGNIDRYVRLRRPQMIRAEYHCIIRGIYHSTTFAKWYSTRPLALEGPDARGIRTAINARFVMCNDLTSVLKAPDEELPYLIWYPHSPKRDSLKELAEKRPEMIHQVARTCIAINYPDVWRTLNVRPDHLLKLAAQQVGNTYFLEDLERRAAELGIDLDEQDGNARWREDTLWYDKEPSEDCAPEKLLDTGIYLHGGDTGGIYDGMQANSAELDIFLAIHRRTAPF